MRNAIILAALAVAISMSPVYADPNTGTIRICRDPIIRELNEDKLVVVPAGSHFIQKVPEQAPGAVEIALTEDVPLGPKPSCAIAHAEVASWPSGAPRFDQYTSFRKQFALPSAELRVSVLKGFR